MKNNKIIMLVFITTFSGCFAYSGKEKLSLDTIENKKLNSVLSSVDVSNNLITIKGTGFTDIQTIHIKGANSENTLAINSQSDSQIVASATSALSLMIGEAFELVLSNANAQASFPITFTIQNNGITVGQLSSLGATNGQIMKYNGTAWIPTNLSASQTYLGTWNATSNSPFIDLSSNSYDTGEYYIVNTLGTFNSINYKVGDWIIYNGTNWEKVDNSSNLVSSFNTRKGAVTLLPSDYVSLKDSTTNKVTGSKLVDIADIDITSLADGQVLKWNSTTSKWINSTPTVATSISLADLSATTPLSYNSTTGVFSLPPANILALPLTSLTTNSGSITATDTILGAFGKLMSLPGDYISKLNGGSMTTGTIALSGTALLTIPKASGTNIAEAVNVEYLTDRLAANGIWNKGASSSINYTGGNVGIGTTSSTYALNVSGNTYTSGQYLAPDGSSSTPSYSFVNYPTNGLKSNSDGSMTFVVGGATGLSVYNNSFRFSSGNTFRDTNTGNAFTAFTNTNATANSSTNYLNLINGATGVAPALGVMGADTNISLILTPKGTGNVGIGTTSPSSTLEINSPVATFGNNQFKVTDGTTGGYFSVSEGGSGASVYLPTFTFASTGLSGWGGSLLGVVPAAQDTFVAAAAAISVDGRQNNAALINANIFNVRNFGTPLMTVKANGNVGIATTAPSEKLEIAGAVRATGSISTFAANSASMDFAAGNTRFYSLGPDTATRGGFYFRQLASDGTLGLIPMAITNTGNVGIGTISPNATLQVNGTITGKASVANATSTVDFSAGNQQYTTSNCGAFILNNMKDGGSYAFAVQGSTAALCSFSAYSDAGVTALTTHMPPNHGLTTASSHTLYNFMVMGTHVYVSWVPGY